MTPEMLSHQCNAQEENGNNKQTHSPNTISFTWATRVPNMFSAWHVIIPWSSKRTSAISNVSSVSLNRLWLPWFPPCRDHVIFGAGFPAAEILSDSLAPSLIMMDGGILVVKRGGAVERWWCHGPIKRFMRALARVAKEVKFYFRLLTSAWARKIKINQ